MKNYIKAKLNECTGFAGVQSIVDGYMDYYNNRCYQWHLAKLAPKLKMSLTKGTVHPCCYRTSTWFTALSSVFVRKSVTRLHFSPYRANENVATGFTLCYGLLFCTCFSQVYLASTQSVAQKHCRLATGLTGDYLDQTFTGKLITACRTCDLHRLENMRRRRTNRQKESPAKSSF